MVTARLRSVRAFVGSAFQATYLDLKFEQILVGDTESALTAAIASKHRRSRV